MVIERLAEKLITFTHMLRPLRHADMTPQQYWLLRHLRDAGPQRIGSLADALGITTGSATVACKRLEKIGLLTRERQTADERIVQVALTEQGCAQIDALRQRRRDVLNQLLDVLDQREQQELLMLIEKLVDAAEKQSGGGKEGQ